MAESLCLLWSFFHIPLPEYNQAAADESAILIGTRMEKACAPLLNTGMFAAMKEAGDVMGTFVGHDHDNDYVGRDRRIPPLHLSYQETKQIYQN